MNAPSPTTSSAGTGTTATGFGATKVAIDAIDRKIMGLRARLTPDPYCDPAFRDEYVTYLSPGSSATVPRSGGLSGLEDSVSDGASGSGRVWDEDDYYPLLGTDHKPQRASQIQDEQEASSAHTTQERYSPLRESGWKHDRQHGNRSDSQAMLDISQDRGLVNPHHHSDGDKDAGSVLRDEDQDISYDRDQNRERDTEGNGSVRWYGNHDRDRANQHDHHGIDRHKEPENRNRLLVRDRAHYSHKLSSNESERNDIGQPRHRNDPYRGHNGSSIPPSPPNEVSDNTKAKKQLSISREDIDYYPLARLPSMLSPTIPSVFDSDEADIGKTLGMITPTLPPYFDTDLSALGIRLEDDRHNRYSKMPSDPVLQSHDNSSTGKPRSRIVVLRVPSFKSGNTAPRKRDLSENVREDAKRRKLENALASREQKAKPAVSAIPQSSTDKALSISAISSKSSLKIATVAAGIASKSSRTTSPISSLSPQHPIVFSKENISSSKLITSPLDRQAATPPSQVVAPNDAASTPGTPSTKKSTLAEYNKRRLIAGGDASFSPASHKNEYANDKVSASTTHRLSSIDSSHNTIQKTSSNGGVSSNTQAAQVLERKAQKWIAIATDRKHESDRQKEAGDLKVASLYAMDALLAYLVGFYYDDKCLTIKNRVPSDKNWSTLVPFTRHLVTLHESSKAPFLAGLSYQIRAVVYLRMAGYQRQTVKALQHSSVVEARESGTAESPETTASGGSSTNNHVAEVTELLTKASRNMDLAAYDFQRATRMFPIEAVIERCPQTWRRRALPAEHLSQSMSAVMGGGSSGPGLRPLEDQFVLPIQMYSSVREVAAFGASLLREWADQNNLKYESVLAKGTSEQ
ncbi:hypothetical protein V1506DRAFT_527203 [Lipomyces tetrasporus]